MSLNPGQLRQLGYRTVDITTEVTALVKVYNLIQVNKDYSIFLKAVKYHTQKLAASIGIARKVD